MLMAGTCPPNAHLYQSDSENLMHVLVARSVLPLESVRSIERFFGIIVSRDEQVFFPRSSLPVCCLDLFL